MTQRYVAFMFAVVAACIVAVFAVLARFGDVGGLFSAESPVQGLVFRLAITGIVSAAVALYLSLTSRSISQRVQSSVVVIAALLCILNWKLVSLVPAVFALGASICWRLRSTA